MSNNKVKRIIKEFDPCEKKKVYDKFGNELMFNTECNVVQWYNKIKKQWTICNNKRSSNSDYPYITQFDDNESDYRNLLEPHYTYSMGNQDNNEYVELDDLYDNNNSGGNRISSKKTSSNKKGRKKRKGTKKRRRLSRK